MLGGLQDAGSSADPGARRLSALTPASGLAQAGPMRVCRGPRLLGLPLPAVEDRDLGTPPFSWQVPRAPYNLGPEQALWRSHPHPGSAPDSWRGERYSASTGENKGAPDL